MACARLVDLSPEDGGVKSNTVCIKGEGTIESFGNGPAGCFDEGGRAHGVAVTKTVLLDAGITLKHSERLKLLALCDRVLDQPAIGIYRCNGDGAWIELHFSATGEAEIGRRLGAIEQRLQQIDEKLERLDWLERRDVDH
ncbi:MULTISPECIES: hypothetical protein [Bradyrhizobium]|uniref:hypothetical protein n=1 Tax=Bradyrhizobium japonicum TaxID=375 RepID=UPI00209EC2AD|nr:hypothetical protein [Bradyrhizobium japonicum]MCP1778811.1 hypothetical protein [Bradyrhizobium japonicum]MCP1958191.1 hypothetical protein [Bradyrhizobium japonicum]